MAIVLRQFPNRYAANWRDTRDRTLKMTAHKCVMCGKKATEVHHVRYKDAMGAIAGRERPLFDVFPLCKKHHEEAHTSWNWVRDRFDPELGNHNREEFVQRLLNCVNKPQQPVVRKSGSDRSLTYDWLNLLVNEWRWVVGWAIGFGLALVLAR